MLEECPGPSEPFFGQDGNYEIAVPSYTERDGTVKDSVTGRVWEKVTENVTFTLAGAQEHCATVAAERTFPSVRREPVTLTRWPFPVIARLSARA